MNIVVFDLEWNQALDGRKPIEGLGGEIIQIGAAKIDLEGSILSTFDRLIKPVVYKKMNRHVSELTLIKDQDLEKGIGFKEAYEAFRSWLGDDTVLISWGPDDIRMLENNLLYFGFDSSWLPQTFDGQLMFDDMEKGEGRQWPLNYALFYFEEKPNGAHNALADVLSTVSVLKHLDLEDGLSDDYFRCDHFFGEE